MQSGGGARHGLRQVEGADADGEIRARHVRGRCRHRRGQGRAGGGGRISARTRRSSSASAAASRRACCWWGPPGTGKTLLARAIAGEANVPFFTISGSDFVEMFVGVGAEPGSGTCSNRARRTRPASSSSTRSTPSGATAARGWAAAMTSAKQTLNQLLVEMDGFETNEGVILIAATNRPDVLDPALLQAGPLRPPGRRAEPGHSRPRKDPQGASEEGARWPPTRRRR